MKILMIGPSKSEIQNYGLGLATENIAKALSQELDLTIISPSAATELSQSSDEKHISVTIEERLLDAKSVDATAVQINVESLLTPYFYHASKDTTNQEEVIDFSIEIQEALNQYNKSVMEEVATLNYDLIYAHDWLSIGAAMQLKTKYNKPFVLHIHALDYDRVGKKSSSWIYQLEKEGMQAADVIIAVSQYHADIIHKVYGIDKQKIKVVSLGIDPLKAVDYSSPFEENIILFAGRLSQQKGVFAFIEIAAQLLIEHKDLKFVIAGDGELAQEVVSKINEKGLSGNFSFTGLLERRALHALMRESKALVVPSISEPFGLVAMEAALNDLPIVISQHSGAIEVLKNCFIPKSDAIADYVEEVEKVLANPKLVKKAIEKNKEAASSRSWKHVGDDILKILVEENE
ncbi:glycosyltransferase family 4 protein [Marivirga atlantica]|uniref:Glycosyltransferase family 4 protein n=1 Tax=Marivirga atlantica TaxID=1548457 RepID=A0A937AA93_9BACT|nr:glycosyltransferase family 4 protein [Marivirga atlantica]MBL0765165.1 glycosyltransferase family 4 protein [Marivirga atlantica]